MSKSYADIRAHVEKQVANRRGFFMIAVCLTVCLVAAA